jgi:hypothetical protein
LDALGRVWRLVEISECEELVGVTWSVSDSVKN